MKHRWMSIAVGIVMMAVSITLMTTPVVNAQAGIISGPYTQDSETLANVGTSSTLPLGWALSETGTNANITYTAGTGSNNAGDTYSFGASGSTERAFGGLQSGSLIPTIGVQFQNNTGVTVGRLAITYNCEQWRLGATGRQDRTDFQYSIDATSLTTGTWTNYDALDCLSFTTTGTVGALDGNTNRTVVSGTIMGLSIADGSTFWIRWIDFNATGSDDGLGVDDFSMSLFTPTAVTLRNLTATSNNAPLTALLIAFGLITLGGGLIVVRWRRN